MRTPGISERAKTRRLAAATLAAFVLFELAVSLTIRLLFPESRPPPSLAGFATYYAVMIAMLILLFAVFERLRLGFVKIALVAMLLSVTSGIAHIVAVRIALARVEEYGLSLDELFLNAGLLIHFYFAWSATVLALIYSRRRRGEQERRSAAERAAHGAQMRAVRYQLNPHFLYNTLNSVGALIGERRDREAERLIRGLSDYLRTGLKVDPMSDQTLAEEFAQQQAYLAIEQVRFPDRLEVHFALPDALRDALVPPFVLNPLVEDAVRHGVAPARGRTRLALSAERAEPDRLVLRLEEAHQQPPPARARHSQDLLQTRLRQRFRADFAIATSAQDDRTLRTVLDLPLRFGEAGA